MHSLRKIALAALLASSGAAAAQSAAAPSLASISGMRGQVLIETLQRYYQVPVAALNQYDRRLTIDSISCELATLAGVLPTCSVTVGGKVLPQATFRSLNPASNLYQSLSEMGAVHPDSVRPGVFVATATGIDCEFGGHGNWSYVCTMQAADGAPLTAQPAVLSSTSRLAEASRRALADSGLPDQSTRQYESVYRVEQVSCKAELREFADDALFSCTVTAAHKTYATNHDASVTLYRLIAASGGATFNAATQSYMATATSLTCANYNMHEDGPTTCSYTLADRHPVLTHSRTSVVSEGVDDFYKGLEGSHPQSIATAQGNVSVSLSLLDCTNTSLVNSPAAELSCVIKAAGQVVTETNRWSTYALFSAAKDALRLDPATLTAAQLHADELSCYVIKGQPSDCRIVADKVFPL